MFIANESYIGDWVVETDKEWLISEQDVDDTIKMISERPDEFDFTIEELADRLNDLEFDTGYFLLKYVFA